MTHEVFISHSTKDKTIADAVCHYLEAAGIPCWIAPRDISGGDNWPAAISKAIQHSRIMVLVFSSNSNSSEQVSREIYLAANNKLTIIPFKIENVEPRPEDIFFLGPSHWLQAMNPPTQDQINLLVKNVQDIVNIPSADPNMLKNIPLSEASRFGLTIPAEIQQAEQEGKPLQQIHVNKNMEMKCPNCGTVQPAKFGEACKNINCGAVLYVMPIPRKKDPLGKRIFAYALESTRADGEYQLTAKAKEHLKRFFAFMVWSGIMDKPNLSSFYSILRLEKEKSHKEIISTMESWVADAKVQAARALKMSADKVGFLDVDLSQSMEDSPPVEEAFFTLYLAAYTSNPTTAESNIENVRVALSEIVGGKRLKEMVVEWENRL